ncbi:class I SAM-dependent RNA methyltransferase [Eubacteriales bacterium OttesenSCG-928-M02]|nr:class I SAM-dependent RNA methyltransferase [Eubacteriales bacterium OttesenSCG-928-M02]
MVDRFPMYATCAFGLESLVRDELKMLDVTEVRARDARIDFVGTMEDGIEANLWSRCADRIFINLGSFPADSFEALFEGIKALDISSIIPKDGEIYVTGKTALSKLVSVRDMQSIGKKAMVESMKARYGYDRCPETGARYHVEIGMLRDEATIGLNLSGQGLNRRGYRDLSVQAPIRETLAAAMVSLAHYDGREILLDPFCGSGTIAIEAAMVASNTAPGLLREFAFDAWPDWKPLADTRRAAARDMRREKGFAHIHGSDVDKKSVSIAQRHARQAGVNGFINFTPTDIWDLSLPADRGVIVTNPPYGKRLELDREIIGVLGRLKKENPKWGVFVISEDFGFEKAFGEKGDKRRRLYNGNTRCEFHMYFRDMRQNR